MNQKKYNALEREYGKFNLKKESFEEIDITDQDELLDFLKEKQTRLYDALENETSGKAIKNKQREIDKIEKFFNEIEEKQITVENNMDNSEEKLKEKIKTAMKETEQEYSDPSLTKIYARYENTGKTVIYGDFEKENGIKSMPLREIPTEISKDAMLLQQSMDELEITVRNPSKNIYSLPEEEEDLEKSNIDNDIPMEQEKKPSDEEQEIFHVEDNDFDLDNLKGNTLIGIGLMNIDGWDPSSLTVTLYDDHSGYISGKVSVEGIKKEIVFGDIDENHNVVYLDDEEIIRQIGVTDRPVDSPEAVIVESAEEIGKRYSEKKEPVKKSKWEKPKDIDAYMVIMSQRGEVFATLNSNGEIYKGGKPDHMLYAKSKVGKTIMNSLDEISKISGVDKKDLVVVDGCSYVTTVDGRQVGILSGDGHVISTEYDIKEQQTLYEFAKENKINSQGLHIEGHIIYSQDNNPLGYMNKDLESFIGSNEKPDITIEEDNIIEERNSYMADQMIENGVTVECDEENLDI